MPTEIKNYKNLSYAEALNAALREEMLRDDNVIIMGEDIGTYGGNFHVTRGLVTEFGEKRVLDTPISETAFVGAGVGAAITGLRPVIELMFSDFMGVCFDQIMNEAAKLHFMYDGKVNVPMVIRTAAGGGTGAAAQHSQSLENMFAHVPGLKVVIPSTPYDAKGLLKASIRDNNPVIFLEQKLLYKEMGMVPEGEYLVPIGKADTKKEGSDISIITYGRMVGLSLEAAFHLDKKGISAEVIDLRSISPLDKDAIISSVCKTGRALIVTEAVKFAGFGAEIMSELIESSAFNKLKCQPVRLGAIYAPIAASENEESITFPTADDILKNALNMCKNR